MALIQSISGIRGTLGDQPGEGLTPVDIAKFVSAYGTWLLDRFKNRKLRVIIGRDARISGDMVTQIVTGTLMGCGIDILDLGMVSTPTVEVAVKEEKAQGGIVITASHNPSNWNALKLLNEEGEFVNKKDGMVILSLAQKSKYHFAPAPALGHLTTDNSYSGKHIRKIVELGLVDRDKITAANFKVVVDGINSVGGIVVPELLRALGVQNIVEINTLPDGNFAHDPEPLPEHLVTLSETVKRTGADLGIAVDPDVDRLALVNEDGSMFGEEYTLVAVADYVLQQKPGNTVSNLSSTRALSDITERYGWKHFGSAVGEVNVVEMMKQKNAVIGGEGNGGVILPAFHYGRDALAGIALFLTCLSKSSLTCSSLRKTYPNYFISKNKLAYSSGSDITRLLAEIKERYKDHPIKETDGVYIDFGKEWVHIRRSNTEPMLRVYAESESQEHANSLAQMIIGEINTFLATGR